MTVLVTGSNGMIGTELVKALANNGYIVIGVDKTPNKLLADNYIHFQVSLQDRAKVSQILQEYNVDRIIHLAALAHTSSEKDLSWDHYYHVNVEYARNLFECAHEIPVLFISTVDVYGFYDGKRAVNVDTPIEPISKYGRSKAQAEAECKKLSHFDIYRFSPVYTESIKRDIQKRYYLKYPSIAYKIGKGSNYEILNIAKAVKTMAEWCKMAPGNAIKIIKDDELMWTPDYIAAEKSLGKARTVITIPYWMAIIVYKILMIITGRNKYTYLLNKAVYPIKTE